MKEHGLIFTGESIRAMLDDRKTQTRSVIKPQPDKGMKFGGTILASPSRDRKRGDLIFYRGNDVVSCDNCQYVRGRYEVGDLIWCRETWGTLKLHDQLKPSDINPALHPQVWFKCDDDPPSRTNCRPWIEGNLGKWRPSIHMPKWACRLWLKITEVQIQRLQDISSRDAQVDWFRCVWDSINAKPGYSWNDNPLVYALTFERKEK